MRPYGLAPMFTMLIESAEISLRFICKIAPAVIGARVKMASNFSIGKRPGSSSICQAEFILSYPEAGPVGPVQCIC
jgi:hypothetical protein